MGSAGITVKPVLWLGGEAPGGLTLPPAQPNRVNLYAPRGVYLDDERIIVADSGNHRILIWQGWPDRDHAPADVVLGQPHFFAEGPGWLHLPTGVAVIDGRLFVADAWHHRLLIWDKVPRENNQPPDHVLGQPNFEKTAVNRGAGVTPFGFYWPYGMGYVQGWFYVADTGNRRVLGWEGIPEDGRQPDVILGQPDGFQNGENRGKGVGPDTFRWPHAVAGDGETLYIADAGNHRILGYTPPPDQDRPANLVLGQDHFTSAFELPHVPQGPRRLRFPYGLSSNGSVLAVADTANNRVLLFAPLPRLGAGEAAVAVIGQDNFDDAGENRWHAVDRQGLCWPYGVCFHGRYLAIADSGNNRVMIWQVEYAF